MSSESPQAVDTATPAANHSATVHPHPAVEGRLSAFLSAAYSHVDDPVILTLDNVSHSFESGLEIAEFIASANGAATARLPTRGGKIAGVCLAFKMNKDASIYAKRVEPSFRWSAKGGQVHLVYLLHADDETDELFEFMQSEWSEDKRRLVCDHFPITTDLNGLNDDAAEIVRAGGQFRVYDRDDFEKRLFPVARRVVGEPNVSFRQREIQVTRAAYTDAKWWMCLAPQTIKSILDQHFNEHAVDTSKDGWGTSFASFYPVRGSELEQAKKWSKWNEDPTGVKWAKEPPKGSEFVRRGSDTVEVIFAVVLDLDKGDNKKAVTKTIEDSGLFTLFSTSHSHGKTVEEVPLKSLRTWGKRNGLEITATTVSAEIVKAYMRAKGYLEHVVESVRNVRHERGPGDGTVIFEIDPIDKMRVVFFLETPFVIADFKDRDEAASVWHEINLGVAKMFGVVPDESAADLNRMFYDPRHHPDRPDCDLVEFSGNRMLDWREVERVQPETRGGRGARTTRASDPYAAAGDDMSGKTSAGTTGGANFVVGEFNLVKWAAIFGKHFISENLIEGSEIEVRSDRPNGCEIKCPFDEEHSDAGNPTDTACYVAHGDGDKGFNITCQHDICDGRDRLEFICKMEENGEIDLAEVLPNADNNDLSAEEFATLWGDFTRVGADQDGTEGGTATTADIARAMELAKTSTKNTETDQITAILKMLVPMNSFDRARIISLLAQNTKVPGAQLQSLLKALELKASPTVDDKPFDPATVANEMKRRFKSLRDEKRPVVFPHEDHPVASLRHILKELARANKGDDGVKEGTTKLEPAYTLFDFGGNRVRISKDANGKRVIKDLSRGTIRNAAMELLYVCKVIDSNTQTEDFLSDEMCDQLLVDPALPVVPLAQFSPHPVFDRDGNLLTATGYYSSIGRFLNLDGIDLSFIKKHYNDVVWKDVVKAVAALKTAFGDFRWTGYAENDDGAGARMSFAHYIALLITPLIYEFLKAEGEGNAMLFSIDKPDAASGGTLLGRCANTILAGTKPDQLQWPRGKGDDGDVELEKKLIPVCKRSPVYLIIDNVHGVIGGSLIASLATGSVSLRSPHSADLFDAELRFPAVFIGNGIAASDENVRRFLPIRIDPTEADEDGNKHFEIEEKLSSYLLKNRSEYLGHLCTIVQWWLKQGRPLEAKNVESFEEFVSIMGGILKAAGIPGWLEGLGAFIATSKKSQADEIGIYQTLAATFKLDADFFLDKAEPLLFNELEGGSSSYQRYEARFAYLEGCVQNGVISRRSLGKMLGYIARKPRKIVYEGETIKVRLTSRESNGKTYYRIVRAT